VKLERNAFVRFLPIEASLPALFKIVRRKTGLFAHSANGGGSAARSCGRRGAMKAADWSY